MAEQKRGPGRPKKNQEISQITRNTSVINVSMEKQIPNAPTCRINPQGYINWGNQNDFPELLTGLYYSSSTHKSCVDFLVTAICGENIDAESIMPNYGETWESFIAKLAQDLVIFGGYAFQVIMNKDGKSYSFYHEPFNNIRCGKPDEDGNVSEMWICKDWTETAKYKPFTLPRFGFNEDEVIQKGQAYLFYYSRYTVDSEFYPLPHYYAALKAIQTEAELLRYDLKSVLNNFSANGVVTFDREDDEEERKKIINGVQKMFTGSENSNTVMVTFKNNDEDKPVTFTPFDKDISNVNLFADNNSRTVDRILSAHRIANPTLIGLPNSGTGFANEGALLEASFNLLNKTLINNMRKEITRTINKMFTINGVDNEIKITPLSFNLANLTEKKEEIIEEKPSAELNNNNIEEKEVGDGN